MKKQAPVILFYNRKGGVGKTTSATNLGHGLAINGLNVLLVDLDPQGHVGEKLGLEPAGDLYRWLGREQADLEDVVVPARPGLDVIRSNDLTADLEVELISTGMVGQAISSALTDHPYDMVLFDCAPSNGVLHKDAMRAADYIILPTQLSQLAVHGIMAVLDTLDNLAGKGRRKANVAQIAGIIPTLYEQTPGEVREQLSNLANGFDDLVWPLIPKDIKVSESDRAGKTLWEYAPGCRALNGIPGIGGGYKAVLARLMELL